MASGINSKSWALNSDDGIPITFWDPNLMHEWTRNTYQKEMTNQSGIYKLEKVNKSLGLQYDARLAIPELSPLFY